MPAAVLAPRFYALAHIAMFDAVNAIEREFQPYHVRAARTRRIAGGGGGAGGARRARRAQPGCDGRV